MTTVSLTTEQRIKFRVLGQDGRGRPLNPDGIPDVQVSDPTVLMVSSPVVDDDGSYSFYVRGVGVGQARVVTVADLAPGETVVNVTGTAEFDVSIDPRTAERTIELIGGTVEDTPTDGDPFADTDDTTIGDSTTNPNAGSTGSGSSSPTPPGSVGTTAQGDPLPAGTGRDGGDNSSPGSGTGNNADPGTDGEGGPQV